MAIGTALLVIFGVWLLIAYPRALLRTGAGLVALVVIGIVAVYVWDQINRPGREREEAAQRARQQAAEKLVADEEAWLLRNRATYHSDGRWLGVAVDRNHCRYSIDLETMAVRGYGLDVWIKVDRPNIEPGVYLSENCYDYGSPRQVFFSCVAQQVEGAWSFTPGMISEDVLRWIQASPWCAKIIDAANAEQERQQKAAALARQAQQERQAELERQRKALTTQQERLQADMDELRRRIWPNAR
jgi:hypothetical protein